MNNTVKGIIAGIFSAITYGMNPLFGIHLYQEGLTPISVLFYRFFFAFIMLGIYMLVTRKSFILPKKQIVPVLFSGFFMLTTCLFWFFSFRDMDSGIAATILFSYPIMVAAIMMIFCHERPSFFSVAAILLASCGVILLCRSGGGARITATGVIYVLLSALMYAIYIVIVKETRLRELPPETLTFYSMIFSALGYLAILRGGMDLQMLPSLTALGNALGVAFFPSFLSFLLIAVSIRGIGATNAGILGALEPLTAVCIGVFVFAEPFTVRLFFGLVLILSSVFFMICGKLRSDRKNDKILFESGKGKTEGERHAQKEQ